MNLYIIGDNPYEQAIDRNTRENGQWYCDAEDEESALEEILTSVPYPGEAVGRWENLFLPGISLEGMPAHEVIQLWSSDEFIVQRLKKATGKFHHLGTGRNVGVVREFHVTEMTKYVQKQRNLLPSPDAAVQNTTRILSPTGANLVNFSLQRQALHAATVGIQFRAMNVKLQMQHVAQELESKRKDIEQKLMMADAYLHGIKSKVVVTRGEKAPSDLPWNVFQGRQFLNREISLLANFLDFDFQKMEELDAWLVKTGKIWKFLPFDKTILVTRIRDENKNYGGGIVDMILNTYNFANVIWVRNGQNVTRIGIELDFENAVFPDPAVQEKLVRRVQERVWMERFKLPEKSGPDYVSRWHLVQTEFGLKRKAHKETEPWALNRIVNHRFKTLEEWMGSADYTEEIDKEIKEAVFDFLRARNMEQMKFLVVLQGIVDSTDLLDIPPGTDLFSPEVCARHFILRFDYSHGLPDRTWSSQIDPLMDIAQLKAGDWIIVEKVHFYKTHVYEKNFHLMLYKVVKLEGTKVGVIAHPPSQRNYGEPVKTGSLKWLNDGGGYNRLAVLRITLTLEVANGILDNREWKDNNQWIVPVLAQWRFVQKTFLANPINSTQIELKEP